VDYGELFNLSGEVVLLLGFTGPIGRQFAAVFAESGCAQVLGVVDAHAGGALHHGLDDEGGDPGGLRLQHFGERLEGARGSRGWRSRSSSDRSDRSARSCVNP